MNGQRIVISGSTAGIGLGIAKGALKRGARVVVNSHLDTFPGLEVLKEIGEAHYVQADMGSQEGPEFLVDEAARLLGGLDHCIANAGVFIDVNTSNLSPLEVWDRTYHVNVRSGFLMAHRFRKVVTAGGKPRNWDASILFNGSINAIQANPNHTAYDGSKGAVHSMARSFCCDFKPWGIRVNVIAPGQTRTDLTEPDWEMIPNFDEQWAKRVPMGRAGTVEDCVGPALFLLSSESVYINGQILAIDGGNTALQVTPLDMTKLD